MSSSRPISDISLGLQSVLVGSKIVLRGSSDVSFATQAMRLLMFCTRYLDLLWVPLDFSVRLPAKLLLLLSTLAVVVLLGYKKFSQNAHKNISPCVIGQVAAILLFSLVFGGAFMYIPTVIEFLWAFSRFIDVFLELPQLGIIWSEDKLDDWMTAYYCSIGTNVLFYILHSVYRVYQNGPFFDIITICTTTSKGVVIATFFVARYFKQRARRPATIQEEVHPRPDPPQANKNLPTDVVAPAV